MRAQGKLSSAAMCCQKTKHSLHTQCLELCQKWENSVWILPQKCVGGHLVVERWTRNSLCRAELAESDHYLAGALASLAEYISVVSRLGNKNLTKYGRTALFPESWCLVTICECSKILYNWKVLLHLIAFQDLITF